MATAPVCSFLASRCACCQSAAGKAAVTHSASRGSAVWMRSPPGGGPECLLSHERCRVGGSKQTSKNEACKTAPVSDFQQNMRGALIFPGAVQQAHAQSLKRERGEMKEVCGESAMKGNGGGVSPTPTVGTALRVPVSRPLDCLHP